MSERLRRFAVVTVLAVVPALSGCGGGDHEDASAGRLSVEAWVERADETCRDAQAAIAELGAPDTADQRAFAEHMAEVAEIGERQLDDLRALRPPEQADVDHRALLDISAKQVEAAAEISDAAARGDVQAVGALVAEAGDLERRAGAIIDRYPFRVCGSRPG